MKDGSVRCNLVANSTSSVPPGRSTRKSAWFWSARPPTTGPGFRPSSRCTSITTTGGTLWLRRLPVPWRRPCESPRAEASSASYNGTCGDINHFDVSGRQTLKTAFIGETLAATVKASLLNRKPLAQPGLAVRSEVVELPLRTYTPEEVALPSRPWR